MLSRLVLNELATWTNSRLLLQPRLELLERFEAMRDLVLLDLVHLGIPADVSWVLERCGMRTHVLPSYSKIGSQPITSEHGAQVGWVMYNLPKFVGPLAGTILP